MNERVGLAGTSGPTYSGPIVEPDNNHCRGKYYYTAGLQFDWLGFSSVITFKEQHIFMFGRLQSSQNGDKLYSDTSPMDNKGNTPVSMTQLSTVVCKIGH